MTTRRGEIYYVMPCSVTGSEQVAGRPAIVVSNDKNNLNSSIVEVVYLTTKEKNDLPTHFITRATGTKSTVLCEQIMSVSLDRVGEYIGTLTDDEMMMLDMSLAISLGINFSGVVNKAETVEEKVVVKESDESKKEKIVIMAQRDLYKEMYENLLKSIINK